MLSGARFEKPDSGAQTRPPTPQLPCSKPSPRRREHGPPPLPSPPLLWASSARGRGSIWEEWCRPGGKPPAAPFAPRHRPGGAARQSAGGAARGPRGGGAGRPSRSGGAGRGGGGHARPGRRAAAEPGAGRPGRGGAGGRAANAGGARPGSAEEERGRRRRPRPPARNSSPKVAAREARALGGRGAGGGGGGDAASRPAAESAGGGGGGMGTRQTKGSLAERASPGAAPGPRRERPDFWASLLLRAGDKAGRAGAGSGLPPYHRRVGMVQELLRMVRQGRREEAGTLLQHLRQVSAGRGRGGAPPLPAEAPERRGAPPGPLLAGMEPGLAAGASTLPLNSRPQDRAEEGWPGEAQLRGTCWNNVPASVLRRQGLKEEEAGPGDGSWEGMPAWAEALFFPSTRRQSPPSRVLKECAVVSFPRGRPRAQPWGW